MDIRTYTQIYATEYCNLKAALNTEFIDYFAYLPLFFNR